MRKFYCFIVLLLFSLFSCDQGLEPSKPTKPDTPKPQPETGRVLRVASYNVHRFFDTHCDSGACAAGDYESLPTAEEYQTQLEDIVRSIEELEADVVLLQEIEKEENLRDIQTLLGAERYPGMIFGDIGRTAGMNVGLLSRAKVRSQAMHRNRRWLEQADGSSKRLARELIEAELVFANGLELTVFTTHWVSKATDPEGQRRLLEAAYSYEVIREHLERHPEAYVIFGGDLNDTPQSPPLALLEREGLLWRSTLGLSEESIKTWRLREALDHIYHSTALKAHHRESKRLCSAQQGHGLSDHCAMRAEYFFKDKALP